MPFISATKGDDDIGVHHDISQLLNELRLHRKERRVKEADSIKYILWNKHSIQVFYRRDGTIGWNKVSSLSEEKVINIAPLVKRITWSTVLNTRLSSTSSCLNVPLIIATVDTPYYRTRLAETMNDLSCHATFTDGTFAPITTVDMLNLSENLSIGAHRILYEGWRKILLPMLLSSKDYDDKSLIFVAEDDLRLSDSVSPGRMREICSLVMRADPDLQILSLGHAYSSSKQRICERQCSNERNSWAEDHDGSKIPPQPNSLLHHVIRGKGVHGTTLLALKHPEGTRSLLNAMEALPMGKRCHFDRFLFHSMHHSLQIALTEPPLVGWAEVSETLTSVGAGCRRKGRGRLGQVPTITSDIEINWVRRTVS